MRIALIGMSGVGKSHWSSELAKQGAARYDCDGLIADRLREELGQTLFSVEDVGDWMGLPTQALYRVREAQYLAYEAAVLDDVLREIAQAPPERFVIDLTGSAIYLAAEQLVRLREAVRVIYLALAPEVRQKMLRAYLRQPRPLIWQDLAPPDDNPQTLERHYLQLLAAREKRYESVSDVTIPYHVHRRPGLTVAELLQYAGQLY